jgi:hypothetical protein
MAQSWSHLGARTARQVERRGRNGGATATEVLRRHRAAQAEERLSLGDAHVTPTMQQQAADALDDLLSAPLAVNLAVSEDDEAPKRR